MTRLAESLYLPRMADFDQLTTRQRECLSAVANHRTYKEVARDLGISESAVEKHLRSAREKLGVDTTADAARLFLLEEGEVEPHGGFLHLARSHPRQDEQGALAKSDLHEQDFGAEEITLRAAELDHPLTPLQTLGLVGRLVLGTIAGLTLLIASAEGLKAVLT